MSNVANLKAVPFDNVDITLNEYVEAYYDSKIFAYDDSITQEVIQAVNLAIQMVNSGQKVYQGRINEFGNFMEDVFCEAFMQVTGVKPTSLGVGYPDAFLNYKGQNYYFEFKIEADHSAKPNAFRMFYTSTPKPKTVKKKNIQDGYHILISFEHDGPSKLSGAFKVLDLNEFTYEWGGGRIQQGGTIHLAQQPVIAKN